MSEEAVQEKEKDIFSVSAGVREPLSAISICFATQGLVQTVTPYPVSDLIGQFRAKRREWHEAVRTFGKDGDPGNPDCGWWTFRSLQNADSDELTEIHVSNITCVCVNKYVKPSGLGVSPGAVAVDPRMLAAMRHSH